MLGTFVDCGNYYYVVKLYEMKIIFILYEIFYYFMLKENRWDEIVYCVYCMSYLYVDGYVCIYFFIILGI